MNKFFDWLKRFFGDKKQMDALVRAAMPHVDLMASIIVAATPTGLDDMALPVVRAKFPRLFDGSILTADELRLYAMGAAGQLLEEQFPNIGTNLARLAVEAAIRQRKLAAEAK